MPNCRRRSACAASSCSARRLDPDDGELTRTRKVRRNTINERCGFLIDALYEGRETVEVDTTITLADGHKSRIVTQRRLQVPEGTESPPVAASPLAPQPAQPETPA